MRQEANKKGNPFLSGIFCILMFLLTCIFIGLLMIRAGNTAVIIRHTDFAEIIDETEISYYIVNTLNNLPFNEMEIDIFTVEEFIKSDAVSDEIGNVAQRYANALTRGDLDFHLSSDDVFNIVMNLEPEFSELFDHQMTTEDSDRLARTINDIVGFEGFRVGDILEDVGIGNTIPFLFISPYLLIFVGILCFVVVLTLFWLNKNKPANAFPLAGIPVLITGLILLAGWLVLNYYPHLLGETLMRFTRITGGVAYLLMLHGIVTASVGLIFSLLYFFFKPRIVKGKRVIR